MDEKVRQSLMDEMRDLTSAEATKAALTYEATLTLGKGAGATANRLLREQQIDPTTPDFDKAKFLEQVKEAMKQAS